MKETDCDKKRQHSLCLEVHYFCCLVPVQMDEEIKYELKETGEQPRESSCASTEDQSKLAYCVTDVPPWYLCIVLSIQVCALCGCFEFPGCWRCYRKTSESVHYC